MCRGFNSLPHHFPPRQQRAAGVFYSTLPPMYQSVCEGLIKITRCCCKSHLCHSICLLLLASSDILTDQITVSPGTPALEAIALLRDGGIGCLPVVENGRLVGVVTERDFV